MKGIETSAVISGIRSKVDGSLGLSIGTPELNPEEKVAFMSLQGMNVKMTVEPLDEQPTERVKVEKGLGGKSPSERLYNVLFVLYKQAKSNDEFEVFYKRNMEVLIDAIKAKLHD